MKKLSILFVALLASGLSLTSCNKDDAPAASLTGKWNYSKEGSVVNGAEVLVDYADNEAGCAKDYTEFSGTNVITDVEYNTTATATCAPTTTTGTYVRSGNTLTVTIPGFTETATILNLTATELKIKYSDGFITVFTKG